MTEQVGLFGGSFNPVHFGHLIVARSIREQLRLQRVVFVPAARPPHKTAKQLAPAEHRWQMLLLAIHGEPGFEASDWELRRPGPNYTIDTVFAFRRTLPPGTGLCWIVGADWLAELPTWHRVSDLLEACRIVTVARPGWDKSARQLLADHLSPAQIDRLLADTVDTPRIEISSTEIRSRLATGLSIRYFVPESVRSYIQQHRLYPA